MSAVATKQASNGKAPSKPRGTRKPAPVVTYLPPQDPAMVKLGSAELIAYGEKGERESIQAGLEFLRRQRNKAARRAEKEAGA